MRLFIAINLSKEAKDYLWQLKEEFRGVGKVKFTPKKNYHLTLKFIGEVSEDRLESIKQRLSKVYFDKFEVSLHQLGHFNHKVLWVNLNPRDKILELAKRIDGELTEFPNDYSFNNHLTLAKIKYLDNKERFEERLGTKIKPLEFRITSFELMKSELSKDGPKYTVLETYYLI